MSEQGSWNTDMGACEHVHDDGAYVLGALSPAERAAYERHLAGCPACRDAVGELAVLPGLLGRLDPAGPDPAAASTAGGSRLPALVAAARSARRRERWRNRWRYGATALVAACLTVVVVLAGGWLRGDRGDPLGVDARLVAMRPVAGAVPVTAEIGVETTNWGTEITMRCAYEATTDYSRHWTFRLVAYGRDGVTEQVGSWLAGPGDEVRLTAITRLTGADLVRLEVRRGDDTPLVAYDLP